METIKDYLSRKHKELHLLNECLEKPLALQGPVSASEVIKQKFQIAAALKSEHALHDWAHTETAWTQRAKLKEGPFKFSYDYQRADLSAQGPPIYRFVETEGCETLYTSSGMAAISTLLMACTKVIAPADLVALPGSYSETLEFVEDYTPQLRRVQVESSARQPADGPQILLLDSCLPATSFAGVLRVEPPPLDLVIFDTTCFACGSGWIRRVLRWAQRGKILVVLVRSHTKLDSLGVEYGRLGSAVFAKTGEGGSGPGLPAKLIEEMRTAVRLFGGAALPAHFPPFVGNDVYRDLTMQRVAAILRNGQLASRYFASALPGLTAELHFVHGLYVTLASRHLSDENKTRKVVTALCEDLRGRDLPLRDAGSFGFDFGAAEWAHDKVRDCFVVRIAVPDLPTEIWSQVVHAIAAWWSRHAA